jgi:hypothetical protein
MFYLMIDSRVETNKMAGHSCYIFLIAPFYGQDGKLLLDYKQSIAVCEELAESDRTYKLIWLKVIVCFVVASFRMLFLCNCH